MRFSVIAAGSVALLSSACATLPPFFNEFFAAAPPAPISLPAQYHPHCMPARFPDPSGWRTLLGVQAATCIDDAGQPAPFVIGFAAFNGASSPAQVAGVRVGDKIVALDGCWLTTALDLARESEGIPPGWASEIIVQRDNGSVMNIVVATARYRPAHKTNIILSDRHNACQNIGRKPYLMTQ